MEDVDVSAPAAKPDTEAKPKPKRRRSYSKRQPAAEVKPVDPTVTALQSDILDLVRQRTNASQRVSAALQAAARANAEVEATRQALSQIEQDIQYRMSLVGQMQGGGIASPQMPLPTPAPWPPPMPLPVTSQPQPLQLYGQAPPASGPRIRTESAVDMREAM